MRNLNYVILLVVDNVVVLGAKIKKISATSKEIAEKYTVTSKILCLIVNKNQKEPFSMYVALAELS